MNEHDVQQLLEALQKTQEILGPLTLSDVSNSLPEAVIRFAENKKLIERITADKQ